MGGGAVIHIQAQTVLLLVLLGGALYAGLRGRRGRKRSPRRRFAWRGWWGSGPGACYRIRVRHPRTGRTVTGYVGQTRRAPQVRIDEHLLGGRSEAPKVWADTVVSWDLLWSGKCTQFGLNWRERWYIVSRRPLYNVQWNTHNARRIQPWRARRQRLQRSQAPMGRGRWCRW